MCAPGCSGTRPLISRSVSSRGLRHVVGRMICNPLRPELRDETHGVPSEREPMWADDYPLSGYRRRCGTSFAVLRPFHPNFVALGRHPKGGISQDEPDGSALGRPVRSYRLALPLRPGDPCQSVGLRPG